ncbi:biotin/lipoate A/B protein ligase [Bacteriovorax sp. Seq25_V]|uniref:lipoyl protein ligase domain-containing protein n=1 Tax=Bacteriovorax sp. Seq25_V TaxID=1201288 RepID=UPI00038A2065|nr:biotin/lipoate A/B protein ligase [Bacteriovorax sp. Seq25_V]EQC47334.1 biotin/lipoate A/B protein ligase family protein [Bacteriovorax sp. Seq25_V]
MKIIEGLNLADFDLELSNFIQKDDHTVFVIKENWDYMLAHDFQEVILDRVYADKTQRVYIICNHPHCLTLGRGLQKKLTPDISLIDFDESLREKLDIPIHNIKRGGGVTFHYPGQLVFYPIISLENQKLAVMDFLRGTIRKFKTILEERFHLENLDADNELIGLWCGSRKIASMGLSTRRFVTYHGLALNLYQDEKMSKILRTVYPCGLSGAIYQSIDELLPLESDLFNKITDSLTANI